MTVKHRQPQDFVLGVGKLGYLRDGSPQRSLGSRIGGGRRRSPPKLTTCFEKMHKYFVYRHFRQHLLEVVIVL